MSGCTRQLFPRNLLQTPVSLKIILLLPAYHEKFQVCLLLSLDRVCVDKEQVKSSSIGDSLENKNFSQLTVERKSLD